MTIEARALAFPEFPRPTSTEDSTAARAGRYLDDVAEGLNELIGKNDILLGHIAMQLPSGRESNPIGIILFVDTPE